MSRDIIFDTGIPEEFLCSPHTAFVTTLAKGKYKSGKNKEKKQCPIFLYLVPGHADAI